MYIYIQDNVQYRYLVKFKLTMQWDHKKKQMGKKTKKENITGKGKKAKLVITYSADLIEVIDSL